jgi:hypothetical protein
MNPKSLTILAAVTAIAVAAAFLALRRETGASSAPAAETELFPELSAVVNDVVELSVAEAGQTATLVRDGDTWGCREANGYRADANKVRTVLVTLARMKVVEPMTKDPARLARLGLDDESGTHVELRDAAGASVAALVVGETQYARSGQQVYARRAAEDQAYRCEADLALSADPMTWVDRSVLKLASSRPSRIEIEHADGELVTVSRALPSDPNWKVADVPGDRGLKTEGVANPMGNALSFLTFDEVKKADELPLDANRVAAARFSTFDNLAVEVKVARIDDANWITVGVAYEAPPDAPETIGPEAPEGEADEAAAPTPDVVHAQQVAAEALELDARLSGWAYRIPQHKADVFLRRMSDLLAPEGGAAAPGGGESELSPEEADAALQAAIEALQRGDAPPTPQGPEAGSDPEPTPPPEQPTVDEPEQPPADEPDAGGDGR